MFLQRATPSIGGILTSNPIEVLVYYPFSEYVRGSVPRLVVDPLHALDPGQVDVVVEG